MNEVVALRGAVPQTCVSPDDDRRLEWLADTLLRNRFLPAPPTENVFVGDGDYRAIGAEFLGHFVRIGGLKPHHRVLDAGCGIGRMAVPLTQYLDDSASYEGFDPVTDGVSWCARNITPAYPNFRFHHLDIAHPLYNPEGHLPGTDLILPFPAESFDFAFMTSVATHLPPQELASYAREMARVIAPGGRLFLTAFVVDETGRENMGRDPRLGFQRHGGGPAWYADPKAPLGAVGFDEGFVEATLAAAGLLPVMTSLGHWRGCPAAHYQDIVVAARPGRPA